MQLSIPDIYRFISQTAWDSSPDRNNSGFNSYLEETRVRLLISPDQLPPELVRAIMPDKAYQKKVSQNLRRSTTGARINAKLPYTQAHLLAYLDVVQLMQSVELSRKTVGNVRGHNSYRQPRATMQEAALILVQRLLFQQISRWHGT